MPRETIEDFEILHVCSDHHLSAAFALRRRVFIEEQRVPVERERDGQDSQAHHVLVLSLETAVGTGRCRLFGEVGKMERIAVDAAMRGRGVGRLIMEALEAWALEQGATVARLASQDSALTFYECLGYQAHGEAFMDAGISHRWMDKCLGRG